MAGLRSDEAKFLRAFSPAEISSEMISHCFLAQLNLSDTAGAAADYQFILDQGRLALISVQNRHYHQNDTSRSTYKAKHVCEHLACTGPPVKY